MSKHFSKSKRSIAQSFHEPSSLTSQSVSRHALVFGSQKINLHQAGREFEPKAQNVQPGSGDLCFLTDTPVDDVLKTFREQKMEVRRTLSRRYDFESFC